MTSKVTLFNDSVSSDEENETEFKINKEYANKYDHWREKELLQKYKSLQEEVSSSSSESEEEEDPDVDEKFFRVLSLLKGRDPKIYDKDFVAFKDPVPEAKSKTKKAKPLTIKDYERKIVLEENGDISEEEEIQDNKTSNESELAKLKREIMGDDDSTDEEDCIKSVNDSLEVKLQHKEPEDFIQFLKGKSADIPDESKKDLSYLRDCWNDPNLDEDEKFLKDFFLNKRYLEKDDFKIIEEMEKLSEEEEIEEKQELFEHKYNFRFEEPDPEFIKRYPRTVGDSLRRKDSRRKVKREDYLERKQREKEQKREELKRLKALKRKEIEEKFFKLQEVTGKEDLNFDENDIESDFDPDKHDKKMKELFNDEFYAVEEEKEPVFSYDEEIDEEDWNHWTRTDTQNIKQESNDQIIDNYQLNSANEQKIDTRSQFEKEMIEYTQERKKKGRKKSSFAKIISNPKPLYDPDGKSFDDYLEEYYKMDYEDIIGDMPVRFKYRKVVPNDFGLSVDEILKADDKDLNQWCSIRKTSQYRQEDEELYDVQAFRKKAQMPALKQKMIPSLFAEAEEGLEENNVDSQNSKRKRKKSKKKKSSELEDQCLKFGEPQRDLNCGEPLQNNEICSDQDGESEVNHAASQDLSPRKKKRSRKVKELSENGDVPVVDSFKQELDTGVIEFAFEDKLNSEKDYFDSHKTSKHKRKRSKKSRTVEVGNAPTYDATLGENSAIDSSEHLSKHGTIKSEQTKVGSFKKSKVVNSESIDNFLNTSQICVNNRKESNLTCYSIKDDRSMMDSFEKKMKNSNDSMLEKPIEKHRKRKNKKIKCDTTDIEKESSIHSNKQENENLHSISGKGGTPNNSNSLKRKHKNKKFNARKKFGENSQSNTQSAKHIKLKTKEDKRLALSDERLAAYGINPKKFKNKIKYSKQ